MISSLCCMFSANLDLQSPGLCGSGLFAGIEKPDVAIGDLDQWSLVGKIHLIPALQRSDEWRLSIKLQWPGCFPHTWPLFC